MRTVVLPHGRSLTGYQSTVEDPYTANHKFWPRIKSSINYEVQNIKIAHGRNNCLTADFATTQMA